jgi:hypothetical protein
MRNRRFGWVLAVLAAVLVGILAHGSYRFRYEHGPYARGWGTSTVTTSLPMTAGSRLLLGGGPVVDKTGTPWRLIAVEPTNLPPGLQVLAARAIRVGQPSDGGFLMMTPKNVPSINCSPLTPLPAGTSTHSVEPILVVRLTHPGQYVITGLLVTYQWGSGRYTDYAPDEFVICAYRTQTTAKQKGCHARVPPPPHLWP